MSRGAALVPRRPLVGLLVLLAAGLTLRVPQLYSPRLINSDEAVNALFIKHLLAGQELAFQNWDVNYYGIVEGLIAVPFSWVVGFNALAFKLAAVSGFVLLVIATYLLATRLFGARGGLLAAALSAAFSPEIVRWSTLATGGSLLIIAWGTFTFVQLDRLRVATSRPRLFALGLMAGFGLYMYELYVVYLAALAAWAAFAILGRRLRWSTTSAALCAAGFALGAAPKLVPVLLGRAAGKTPSYHVAGWQTVGDNLHLLFAGCIPALFGVNPADRADLRDLVGPTWPGSALLGLLVLIFYAAAWLWGAQRACREIADKRPGVLTLIVLLVPLTALLFAASANPQGLFSDRYLFPFLSSLPVLAGGALDRWLARRSPAAAATAALAVLLVAFPTAQIVAWDYSHAFLDRRLHPIRRSDPLEGVIAYLRQHGFRGAYSSYWTAYEATFLADERIVVTPLGDWDRYPPYTRYVDGLPRVAYIVDGDESGWALPLHQKKRLLNLLESAGAAWQRVKIGPYDVYQGPGGARLLPTSRAVAPVRLLDPRAEIAAGPVPNRAAPGERLRVPIRVVNTGSAGWSSTGFPLHGHDLAVDVCYRWFDAAGRILPEEGERSLLPSDVAPGQGLAMVARVRTPTVPGVYELTFTLVQEDVAWFDRATGSASARARVEVSQPAAAGAAR